MRRTVILFLASAGFTGYFPVASGTVGSMVAVPLFWGYDRLLGATPLLSIAVLALLTGFACWVAGQAEEMLQEHDSSVIVIDEVVGYLAATLLLPPTWSHTIVAFLAFRLFDVLKPFPAGYIDARLPGGYGVVLDDIVAGLYANVVTRLVFLVV